MSTTDQLRRLAVKEETQKIKVDGPMPSALVFNVAVFLLTLGVVSIYFAIRYP